VNRAPYRAIVAARDTDGPGGGTVTIMKLECGHLVWRRARPPRRGTVACIGCWLDAAGELFA
jgi:hypothetical protein